MGGRPGRLDRLTGLFATQPFVYIQTAEDDPTLLAYLDENNVCPERFRFQVQAIWFCNGQAPPPVADFDDQLSLTSAGLPDRLDDDNRFTLFWKTEDGIEGDYTVFLHIVDADGNLVGQWDQPPGGLDAPTSTWTPQTIYFDDYRVPAEAGGTPPYRLRVGLYDPKSGERLSVVDSSVPNGGDYLELKTYADIDGR